MDSPGSTFPTPPTPSAASEGVLAHSGAAGNEVLIFRLAASLFGVPALAVREIVALPALAPLAETAPFVMGVLDLRGVLVPVVDLSARLGWDSPPLRLSDQLVVLDWDDALVAILVSEVRAVSRVSAAHIEAPPAHGRLFELPAPFVAGVMHSEDGVVMLLHLPHLLGGSSPPSRPAPRFDAHPWTQHERAILQARAFEPTAADANEAPESQMRPPVAVIALGGEEFGVELRAVREFAAVRGVTRVPCCPPHIVGQINLRGDIVTLVDARPALRTAQTTPPFFHSSPAAPPLQARPVVVVPHEDGAVGIVVDDVRDVFYPRDAADDTPQNAANPGYFVGSTLYEGRLLPLLDVARLLREGGLEVQENV